MFQAGDVVETDFEGFLKLLRSKTRAFVSINDHEYYITHTDGYWRVQDCEALNDKGHFTDCSELVNTVCEVVELPSTRPSLLNSQHSIFSRNRRRRPRAGGLFCRYAYVEPTINNELVDDSQNSD